jgi:hypothetical protein
MRPRPTEPTSALAALIAGNHRHLEAQRGAGSACHPTPLVESGTVPREPFALVIANPQPSPVTPDMFSHGHDDVLVMEVGRDISPHVASRSVKLVVVIECIPSQLVEVSSAWMHAELRAFSRLEALLRGGASLRSAALRGEKRVVAALLEHPAGRVHWIGEHPEADLLVREP